MNYQELFERLRKAVISPFDLGPVADAIETLLAENERLKAELATEQEELDQADCVNGKIIAENGDLKDQLAAAQEELRLERIARTDDQIYAADQLAKAEQQVAEWQPIETAPKIGAHLAIDLPNDCARRPYVIVWLDADHPDADGAGWYEHWSFDPVEPTHWMPLPKAPNGASS